MIEQTFGCCRLVYNLALQVKMTAYKDAGIKLSAFDLCYQLVDLKHDYKWLQEVDSQCLQAAISNMDNAFKGFFSGKGYPKFKNKDSKQSFQCPRNVRKINWDKSTLTIPKIRSIPIRLSRKFNGQIKTITISKTGSGKYFASILVENEYKLPISGKISEPSTIGIDLGIKSFAVLSNGTKIENPQYLRNNLDRLKCLQRRVSRKNKGSNNRKKANKKVAIEYEKVTNRRNDFLHKTSTKLVRDSQTTTFCIETLWVRSMVKNHKIAQAINDVSWSEFTRQLKYKCDWSGKNLIQIGHFEPSSKMCSNCGAINKTLTLAHREWTCASCLVVHDRDINAATNIKNMGLNKTGWDTSVVSVELSAIAGTKKQKVN